MNYAKSVGQIHAFWVSTPTVNIFLRKSMHLADESSMNFLQMIFPEDLQRGDLSQGVVKMSHCPWVVQAYCPGTEPKFRPGWLFAGLD